MAGSDRGGAAPRSGGSGTPGRRGGERSVSALIDAVFSPGARDDDALVSEPDLQSLLAASVRDLARRTAATRVVAWLARDDGSEAGPPLAVATRWLEGEGPPALDGDTFAALRTLDRPADLAGHAAPTTLHGFALGSGLACALALSPDSAAHAGPGPVVLALGGPDELPGRVRPRTLAMLADVGERLRGPLTTHLALARLARLDEAVRALDRRAALGDLVAEIVHEVRNPLVSVKTFLQLVPSRLDDREFLDDFRPVVVDEVTRLERLLDSVLQHARPSADDATRGTASVAETFDAIARLLDYRATERTVEMDWSVDAGVEGVAMARDALRQVVLNLTLNAIDATSSGGRVTLGAHVRDAADGRFVEIRVEDDGGGFPAEQRQRIFEAFYSTRPDRPGGLGLAISRKLVEAAAGTIRAGEAPGGGASIAVRLPAAPRL